MAARKSSDIGKGAERLTPTDIATFVKDFVGTKTLVVDRHVAEALLAYNTANRRVNRRKLDVLVEQIAAGEFVNTGEPIIVSSSGILNDGQHRLTAVLEADATVEMDVRFGVPREYHVKTDTGASRTPADVLSIKGVKSGSQVAATLRLLLLYERGLPDHIRTFISNAEVSAAHERWPDIEDIVALVGSFEWPKGAKSTSLLATAFLASRSPQKAKLQPWLDAVSSGTGLTRTDPAYVLREKLIAGVSAATREGLLERLALQILGWNLWVKGEQTSKRDLKWSAAGKGAEPFPKLNGARL